MAYVYILRSLVQDRFYIGSTNNLEQRFQEHSQGKVISTKAYLPWELVFKQECISYREARYLENRLKRFKRKDFIDKIVKEGRINSI